MAQIDVSGFNVPETPYRAFNPALKDVSDNLIQQQRYNQMLQKQKEEDEWKKLGLIQDMADLSKYQTGSEVANAVGNKLADEAFQQGVAAAPTMNPNELAAFMKNKIGSLVTSMEGVKNDLAEGDKHAATIKQLYPDWNAAAFTRDWRADVIKRHMKSASEFNNPLDVPQTQMDVTNPEFLSRYVTGDSSLKDYFQNPKGLDKTTVFKGNPDRYTKFEAPVAPWRTLNYDPEKAKSGFINVEPSLGFKTQTLPHEALPSSKDKPFEMLDENVFNGISGKEKMELIRATKQKFGNDYDNFSPTEKTYAQRQVALDYAKAYDQTNFHPTEVHTPSAALLKLNMPNQGKAAGNSDFVNMFPGIQGKTEINKTTRWDSLTGDEQNVVKAYMNNSDKEDVNGENTGLTQDGYGNVLVYRLKKDDSGKKVLAHLITTLSKDGVNMKASTPLGVKAKEAAHQDAKSSNQATPHTQEGYSRSELKSAGWTDDQIEKATKAGRIKVHD